MPIKRGLGQQRFVGDLRINPKPKGQRYVGWSSDSGQKIRHCIPLHLKLICPSILDQPRMFQLGGQAPGAYRKVMCQRSHRCL